MDVTPPELLATHPPTRTHSINTTETHHPNHQKMRAISNETGEPEALDTALLPGLYCSFTLPHLEQPHNGTKVYIPLDDYCLLKSK